MRPRGWTRKSARLRFVSRRCGAAKKIVRAAPMVPTGTPIGKRTDAPVRAISDGRFPPSPVNPTKPNAPLAYSAATTRPRTTDDGPLVHCSLSIVHFYNVFIFQTHRGCARGHVRGRARDCGVHALYRH